MGDDRPAAIDALIEMRQTVASYLDIRLVGFPKAGTNRFRNGRLNLTRALDCGVNVIGILALRAYCRTRDGQCAPALRNCCAA